MADQSLPLALRLKLDMEIISVCPLRAAPFVWEPRPQTWVMTIIVKATYTLRSGEALLAAEQDPLYGEDERWNRDPSHSVRAPADLLPVKLSPEVMLSGHAYAEGGRPTRMLQARIVVASVDKKIEIYADRSMGSDGAMHEGAPFVRFPVVYERTAGGADTKNPVGMPATRDASGQRAFPNIVRPGLGAPTQDTELEPTGFGPIAADWPSRKEKLGPHQNLAFGSIRGQVLPPDVDMAFFSQAPPDQQLNALHEDEWIALEHLHPTEPRLVTRLPGLRPVVFVDRPGRPPQKLAMRPDTLWIDSDRGIATLTFRAPVALESPDETGRILVAMDPPGLESKWEDVEKMAEQRGSRKPSSIPPSSSTPEGLRLGASFGPGSAVSTGSETMVWQAPTGSPSDLPPPPSGLPAPGLSHAAELIELLAWDPIVIPRIRRIAGYGPLLAALQQRPRDIDLDAPHTAESLPEVGERREIFEIIARAEPMAPRAMAAVLESGIREDGKYVAPLALTSGELTFHTDLVAELKAATAIASFSLEDADKSLAALVAKARQSLACAEAPCTSALASVILDEMRALLDAKKGNARALFEERLAASLLPSRAYERVGLFGDTFLRADLLMKEQTPPFVVYVPTSFEKKLPLFRKLRVRMLCEVVLRADERETASTALRALAIARITKRDPASETSET